MRRIKDPFPPTPERFHLRVEQTLMSLEERDMNKRRVYRKTALLVAAILAALLVTTAVAAVIGGSKFSERLQEEGATEAADLVQDVHLGDVADAGEGFRFSIDELIREDRDLYISYSLAVPDDANYLVAMFTPTLNGEKLNYDAKGWTAPKFFDPDEGAPAVLLLGGSHGTRCNELWTFAVTGDRVQDADSQLSFRVVLLRTEFDFKGYADWTDMLNPPESIRFGADWRDSAPEGMNAAQSAMMNAVASAFGDDNRLSLVELVSSGCADVVDEREITMRLDASTQADVIFNDVVERDFDRFDVHVHVDRFAMTHLGVEIAYTCSIPGATRGEPGETRRLNAFIDREWGFCTADGRSLGYSLGATGGGGWSPLADGTPAYGLSWRDSVFLTLDDVTRIAFAPVVYEDDADGGNSPVYDMDNAILLTPVFSEAVADADARAAISPDAPSELNNWQRKSEPLADAGD